MTIYLKLLRPKHWVKNLLLFAGPFFGGKLFHPHILSAALPAFIAFSLATSAVYIFNDIRDIEKDRIHPEKNKRPLPSRKISRRTASVISVFLAVASLLIAFSLSPSYSFYIACYLALQAAYSINLKNIPVVDIFCIALGFVIRVFAGGEVFNVEISHWLFLTMFMLSLFLATGKRLGENALLSHKASEHRTSLLYYPNKTLNEILTISSSASLISYALYTVEQFDGFVYTVPIVSFGLFRYILLSKQARGDPTDAIITDTPLALTVVLWLLVIGIMRYGII